MRGLKRNIPLLLGSILIFSLAGCFFLPQEDEILQPPLRAPDRVEYRTVEVTRGDLHDEIRGFGTVEGRSGATVSFGDISGRIKQLYFASGQNVEEGDLLAELFNEDLLEALYRQEIYTRLAEIEFEKTRNAAALDREAAQLRLDLSRLDLEKARAAVENTRVYAPISGFIVYTTNRRVNDFIEPFSTLYTIINLDDLYIRVSDDFASKLLIGTEVRFTVNDTTHYGRIIQAPAYNPGTAGDRNVSVIDCDTLDPRDIHLGASILLHYSRESVTDVIIVQRSLIRFEAGRSYVFLLENGFPVERDIIMGITANAQTEVIEGLYEGELIIIN